MRTVTVVILVKVSGLSQTKKRSMGVLFLEVAATGGIKTDVCNAWCINVL